MLTLLRSVTRPSRSLGGYLKHYTSQNPCNLESTNKSFRSFCLNGATIRIFGADNPDALRGMYFDGVVIDEVAQIKPTFGEK